MRDDEKRQLAEWGYLWRRATRTWAMPCHVAQSQPHKAKGSQAPYLLVDGRSPVWRRDSRPFISMRKKNVKNKE